MYSKRADLASSLYCSSVTMSYSYMYMGIDFHVTNHMLAYIIHCPGYATYLANVPHSRCPSVVYSYPLDPFMTRSCRAPYKADIAPPHTPLQRYPSHSRLPGPLARGSPRDEPASVTDANSFFADPGSFSLYIFALSGGLLPLSIGLSGSLLE